MAKRPNYNIHPLNLRFIKRLLLGFLVFLLFHQKLIAQTVSIPLAENQILILKDSVIVPGQDTIIFLNKNTDYKIKTNPYSKSEAFYDSLRSKSYRSSITKKLYALLLRSPTQNIYNTDSISKSESYFVQYTGQHIQKLSVSHVPIFEGNVKDTSIVIFSKIGDWINKTKRYSKPKVILANILFKEGEALDPYILADSERMLRALSYIEDARIYIQPIEDESGEVEVIIVVKDRFPWGVGGKYSSLNNFQFDLFNRNIMGSGNQLTASYIYNSNEMPRNGYAFSYLSQPFRNTLIQSELSITNHWKKKGVQARVFKDFLSPETDYGGEIAFGDVDELQEIELTDTSQRFRVHRKYWDSWAGKSLLDFDSKSRYSLIGTIRYMQSDFLARPEVTIDSNERYHDRKLFIGGLTFLKVNFLKTSYILSFGITEDVPVGFGAAVLHGRDVTEFRSKNYSGGKLSWAHYFKNFGYFSIAQEAGAFWDWDDADNVLFITDLGYFTPLLKLRRLRIRNFMRMRYIMSNHLSFPERFNLEDEFRGLGGKSTQGENMLSAKVESVWFMPWFLYGFRFAPFLYYEFGSVEDSRVRQIIDANYGGVGTGLRIRNESLAIRTFEFHVSWIPNAPEGSNPVNVEFSLSTPLAFENLFNAKPRVILLE